MAHGHGLYSTLCAPPGHHCRSRSESAVEDFVPSDDPAALRADVLPYPAYHIALKLIHILQAFVLHPLLAFRAGLPMGLAGLVAADMDVFRREKLHDLVEYGLKEGEDLLASDAEITVLIWFAAASELGICRENLLAVARHLDFGDYLYMPFGCIGKQLADVILRIITAVCSGRTFLGVMTVAVPPLLPCPLRPPCGESGQARIGIDLQTPARRVGKMDMHPVHLEEGHGVHLFLEEIHASEMARDVEMKTSVRETRGIGNAAASYFLYLSVGCHLAEGLPCIELSRLRQRLDGHPFRGNLKNIGFGASEALRLI